MHVYVGAAPARPLRELGTDGREVARQRTRGAARGHVLHPLPALVACRRQDATVGRFGRGRMTWVRAAAAIQNILVRHASTAVRTYR